MNMRWSTFPYTLTLLLILKSYFFQSSLGRPLLHTAQHQISLRPALVLVSLIHIFLPLQQKIGPGPLNSRSGFNNFSFPRPLSQFSVSSYSSTPNQSSTGSCFCQFNIYFSPFATNVNPCISVRQLPYRHVTWLMMQTILSPPRQQQMDVLHDCYIIHEIPNWTCMLYFRQLIVFQFNYR